MVKIRIVTLLSGLALCLSTGGCRSADPAPAPDPAAAPTPRQAAVAPASAALSAPAPVGAADAPISLDQAQAMGLVVSSDPETRARAFENGLVGRPPPSPPATLAAALAPAAPSGGCNLPPGEPCDEPPPPASLSVAPVTVDTLRLTYTCGTGSGIVQTSPTAAPVATDCFRTSVAVTGLQPGTTYCYAVENSDGTFAAGPTCATTPFPPYLFNGPGLSQVESDQMAARFDWTHTNPVAATVATGSGTQTALYSMNVLVKQVDDLTSLRAAGMHTQTQPLLPDEEAAWDGTVMKAMIAGQPAGVWITAVVPGPIYNHLRSLALTSISQGYAFGIQAMVFRRINFPGAAVFPNTTVVPVSPLVATFLIQQGLEFNGFSPKICFDTNPRTCQIQQGLFLGWLAAKIVGLALDIVLDVVDGVRELFGAIERLIVGEVDVTLQIVLNNSDEAFGTGEPTRSGWNDGNPLLLRNLPVRVYQGIAEFTATTDEFGMATVHVAKNRDGRVCLDLDNGRVNLIDTFVTRRVCIGHFPAISQPTIVPIVTTDKYANALAVMTDTADYLKYVMSFEMSPVSVLTGWQSSLFTTFNGNLSFTPCMGRMPNLTATLALSTVAAASSVLGVIEEAAEFLTAYDIILAENDVRSRGVAAHEFGHVAMCQLLRSPSDVDGSLAYSDFILGTLVNRDWSKQQAVIGESFADFVALQAVGGTNYVAGSNTQYSRSMSYCLGDSTLATDCLDANTLRCSGSGCDFDDNVKWSVSLLQDAFDWVPDAAELQHPSVYLPNDGSHWALAGSTLVPFHTANQVASGAVEADVIELPGPQLQTIFNAWAGRGSVLRYDSFYGGLAETAKFQGYSRAAVCAMFAAHEPGGGCPGYVKNVFGDRIAYARADLPLTPDYAPDAAYSFDGAAGGIAIHRSGRGLYRVTVGGVPAWGTDMSASVSVTAVGSSAITCSVARLDSTADSTTVDVQCWDNAARAAADSPFSILVVGDSIPPSPSAFLASGGPAPVAAPSPLLSWTSGSHPQTVTHNAAAGDYNVNFGVGNAPMSAKLVTPGGATGGERCNNAQGISAGLEVKCYDRNGAPADGTFYTAQIAGGRPGQRFGFAFASDRQGASYTPLTTAAFNSSGGAITATRSSVGHYRIDFAGLQKTSGHAENVQVTGIGTTLVTCNVVGWSNSADGLEVSVECRDGAGNFVDSRYDVMVIE